VKDFDLNGGSREFSTVCRLLDLLSPIPALALVSGYLAFVLDLSGAEWGVLTTCLTGSTLLVGVLSIVNRRGLVVPILAYLDRDRVRQANHGADADRALQAITSLPLNMLKYRFIACMMAPLVVPVLMWVVGFEAWLKADRFFSLFSVSLAAAMLGDLLVFYWAKQKFGPFRIAFAAACSDGHTSADLAPRYALNRKLMLAVVIPTFASLVLVVDLFGQSLRSVAIERAEQWAMVAVESVARAEPTDPLESRIANRLPQKDLWPIPLDVIEIQPGRLSNTSGSIVSEVFLDALEDRLGQGEFSGPVRSTAQPEIGAFRRLDDGRLLIAKVLRSEIDPYAGLFGWGFGFALVGLLGVAVGIGRLASFEISRGVGVLRDAAERFAHGDLTRATGCDAEDEIGDVGRGLEAVRALLRTTAQRIESASSGAAETIEEIGSMLADLNSASSTQANQIRQSTQFIGAIEARFGEISESTGQLTSRFDESNRSVVALGAAGDELKDSAGELTSKVEGFSDSLEEMTRSGTNVSATTDKLAAVSEETSSSMEEMASAMRAVDTSAETTANLSREVVEKAELGQAKVVQTIAGMDAIREATDVAESVIRGLGARTNEIGGILDVIDDVADETNLLALNAAIIAAQAGEHGKAFSVVADEIKELADRVLASTKEIGALIRAVQDESENAIGAIEAGSASVMSGVDLSAEAGRTLEEITEASRESGTRIDEIVASVREQTKAASHVVALMERVRDSAEAIGAVGTEQDQGSGVLHQSALAMREVALSVRSTSVDQVRGFSGLKAGVDAVGPILAQVVESLGQQSAACVELGESIGLVSAGTSSTEEVAEKMRAAIRRLDGEVENLRDGAQLFRV
jgi:methyl-accepting chemotaxis protein